MVRCQRQNEQTTAPLRTAGDAAVHQQTAGPIPGRQSVRTDFQRDGLRVLMFNRTECQQRPYCKRQRNSLRGAQVRRKTGVSGQRRYQDERPQSSAHGGGADSRETAGQAGVCDWRVTRRSGNQARLKTSVPFVPPNPNEFFSATSIFISRAVLAQ